MNLSTVIVAHNELEHLKICIETLRKFSAGDIIVIDNASSDHTREWLDEQEDISSAYYEGKTEKFAFILNEVFEAFQLQEHVLILEPGTVVTPGCTERMERTFEASEECGLVTTEPEASFQDYGQTVEKAAQPETEQPYLVVGVKKGPVMLKRDVARSVGLFSDDITGTETMWIDFQFRMLKAGYRSMCCPAALVYSFSTDNGTNNTWKYNCDRDMLILEEKWGMHYFNIMPNRKLSSCIKKSRADEFSVLEVGCDCGANLLDIRNNFPNAKLYGAEINPNAARLAALFADRVDAVNIEEETLEFPEKSLDYIIFGDVLEHLRDPEKALLKCGRLLKPAGRIIASIPNVMNIAVVQELLRGNFTYQNYGLLDKTHIHMFTFNEIVRMFGNAGYDFDGILTVCFPLSKEQEELIGKLTALVPEGEKFMYETFQYLVIAKRKDCAG